MHRCTTYKADIPHECCVLHTDTTHHTYLEFCGVSLGETSWNCFICRLCESFVYIILYSVFIFLTMCTYLWVEGFCFQIYLEIQFVLSTVRLEWLRFQSRLESQPQTWVFSVIPKTTLTREGTDITQTALIMRWDYTVWVGYLGDRPLNGGRFITYIHPQSIVTQSY